MTIPFTFYRLVVIAVTALAVLAPLSLVFYQSFLTAPFFQANAALSKATSTDVRNFAQMMVTDHTNALNTAQSLFSSHNITATDNTTSTNLRNGSQQTITALNTYSRSSFDRTYMQAQVDAHQWLLNTLDSTLIPSAHSSAVRTLLQTQRGTVASHLDRARQILQGLPR